MLIFIAAGISFAIPFLPSVGGKAGKADREDYKKRAYNYDGKVFHTIPLWNRGHLKSAELQGTVVEVDNQ